MVCYLMYLLTYTTPKLITLIQQEYTISRRHKTTKKRSENVTFLLISRPEYIWPQKSYQKSMKKRPFQALLLQHQRPSEKRLLQNSNTTIRTKHSVWKSPKMSHLQFFNFGISTNFCPIKSDLSGFTVWPQASYFQKLAKIAHFWPF